MRRVLVYDVKEQYVKKVYDIVKMYMYPYQRSVFLGEINERELGDLIKRLKWVSKVGHLLVLKVDRIEYEIGNPYRWQTKELFDSWRSKKKSKWLKFADIFTDYE